MKVQEYPASALGNEMQMQSALQGGVQEMSCGGDHVARQRREGIRPARLPLCSSQHHPGRCAGRGPLGQAMTETLPEKDLIALGYWGLGFRNTTNSKRPIAKVEDFDGLKLRVIPNPVFLETFKAFKANPVPMNFGELYGALENKTVDGQENPYSVILSNKFFEVQKYVSAPTTPTRRTSCS